MYVGIPFSSVLITQWNKSIFGLSVTFLASIPMTAELLATMLCSLLLLPVYRRMSLKLVFAVSTLISAAANFLCFFASSPEQLIILRFCSGIGFAGIKYSLNTIVSLGSLTPENTTDNLAALNAGLLGGITCGGTLGAVIAKLDKRAYFLPYCGRVHFCVRSGGACAFALEAFQGKQRRRARRKAPAADSALCRWW